MTSIEINKTEILEKIREKFKSKLGEKISDEEILDKCLVYINDHIEEVFQELSDFTLKIFPMAEKKIKIDDMMTGILEDEYNLIKSSGKTLKEEIRGSWRF